MPNLRQPEIPEEYIQGLTDIDGKCNLGRFTIINNALRGEEELGEIVAATGADQVIDIVTFPLERIALIQTVAIIQTEAQIHDEFHLRDGVEQLYQEKVLPAISEFSKVELLQIENIIDQQVYQASSRFKSNILIDNNPIDKLIKTAYLQVQERIDKGLYEPGKYNKKENIDSIVLKIVADKLYTEQVTKEISRIVEVSINQAIDAGELINVFYKDEKKSIPLVRMPTHSGADRLTFMIAGPPACGKGGIEVLMRREGDKLGIDFLDVVKINTDFYREIISVGQILGKEKKWYAALNNDEAAIITGLTRDRLITKINQGSAPHTLLDTVNVKQSKIDFGTKNNGVMKIKVITLDPAISLPRAQKRGEKRGRFVPEKYALSAHKRLGNDLTNILQNNKGKSVEFKIYDNNVPIGTPPTLIQMMDLNANKVEIGDVNKYGKLYGRKSINVNPQNTSFIYDGKPPEYNFDQIASLQESGYKLTYHEGGPSSFQDQLSLQDSAHVPDLISSGLIKGALLLLPLVDVGGWVGKTASLLGFDLAPKKNTAPIKIISNERHISSLSSEEIPMPIVYTANSGLVIEPEDKLNEIKLPKLLSPYSKPSNDRNIMSSPKSRSSSKTRF